jgi:mannose-6-phosphate isomerase class I
MMSAPFRKTTQHLAPARHTPLPEGTYDIYPAYPVGSGTLRMGYDELARSIVTSGQTRVLLDGYAGALWDDLRHRLDGALRRLGTTPRWQSVEQAWKPEEVVDAMIAPYLGGSDPIFGTRSPLVLHEFFVSDRLKDMQPGGKAGIEILYGSGAALAGRQGLLVYCDVPKNEIQFRSRAGSIRNLGASSPSDTKSMYKRYYFVDWPALNRHRIDILPRIDLFVDTQRPDEPVTMSGDHFRKGLNSLATTVFRVRPWFEPGPWGGQWIKRRIPQLSGEAQNLAWSFELISPENGVAFESDGILCEASFDFLMFSNHRNILGSFAQRFGYEFPIRYDFLDTFDGGNLSLQCHPRPEYANRHFGETFTQDETYYILDCKPGARVYLGFRDKVKPSEFRTTLDRSFRTGSPVDVESFVNTEAAQKHDLFLIPNGTIHCSGVNNLVLEISSTPYIFTFKMYDWLRMDLDGEPRPLNIERAFENLYFDRRGEKVRRELVSRPSVIGQGPGWTKVHLPTHPHHFYDVHRFEFSTAVGERTEDSCHVMSLVEGESVTVETGSGFRQRFNYAETFVIPAAAGSYRLINHGPRPLKVVKTFLKPEAHPFAIPEGAR